MMQRAPLPPCHRPDAKRSATMRAVRSTGNASTELTMVALLRKHGLKGWRRHLGLLGRPDFTWPKQHVVLFVHGCFWHGCPHCLRPLPITNSEYWSTKIKRNIQRDRRVARRLRQEGWQVITAWEHTMHNPTALVARLKRALSAQEQ